MSRFQGRTAKVKVIIVLIVVLIVALVAIGAFLLVRKVDAKKSPEEETKATTARIITKVGDLYELPSGEDPTVAAIQDRSKLEGQAFFQKAQNGDFLLVYTKAKVALLYRESADKLVNVGPINTQDPENKDNEDSQATTGNNTGTNPLKNQ